MARGAAPSWTEVRGSWTFPQGALVQRDVSGTTSCYHNFGLTDFTATFSMRLTKSADEVQAETKFMFSNGENPDQPYRIDFIYKLAVCRITARRFVGVAPIDLVEGKEHEVKVRVRGGRLDVTVDALEVYRSFPFGKLTSDGKIGFGTYNGTARFSRVSVQSLEPKQCFVIMPFDEKRNMLYEYVLKPMLQEHRRYEFAFDRADELLTVGQITADITRGIDGADLVIADVTRQDPGGYNPNVFYEIGYSRLVNRRAILLIQRESGKKLELPFDTKDFRHYPYDFSRQGFEDLRRRLDNLVVALLE